MILPSLDETAYDRAGIGGRTESSIHNTTGAAARTGDAKTWMTVADEDLKNMNSLTVLPEEGIIYCPIPKVHCFSDATTNIFSPPSLCL